MSRDVQAAVRASGIQTGLCHVFVCHTSASLMLCENADPSVMRDMEAFMSHRFRMATRCSRTRPRGLMTWQPTCAVF